MVGRHGNGKDEELPTDDKLTEALMNWDPLPPGQVLKNRLGVKGFIKRLLVLPTLVAIVVSTAWLGMEVYNAPTALQTPYHYTRMCSVPNDMDVKGSRRYTNKSFNILGFKFVDVTKGFEKTTLDSSLAETTIIGFEGNTWWSVYNPAAEPRVIHLKEADYYVFIQGEKTYVVQYQDFCK